MPEHQQLLWYAGFGSNLNDNRFARYIDGGSLPGLSRHHPGCRDRTPPRQAVTCIADGRMRFTGQVEAWGSGGGVSSFEPSEGRSVILRAFLITSQQMVDVLLQENRLDPSDRPDVSLRLERRIAAAYTDANVAMIPLEGLPDDARYDRLHLLCAYGLDGHARRALVLGSSLQESPSRPSEEYLGTVRHGLRDSCGLSAAVADEYLATCLSESGPEGDFTV